jgi:hypothetical protein
MFLLLKEESSQEEWKRRQRWISVQRSGFSETMVVLVMVVLVNQTAQRCGLTQQSGEASQLAIAD